MSSKFIMASNLTFTTVNGKSTIASNLIQAIGSKFTMAHNLTQNVKCTSHSEFTMSHLG